MKYIVHILLLFCCTCLQANEKKPIRVLLFSGANNHNWQETTPALQNILESGELCEVTVTDTPGSITKEYLQDFDAIVSNWNLFPEKNGNWSETTKQALLSFINEGKGFVFVHAASSTHYDWLDYQKLAGATWGKGTHHGRKANFEVKIEGVDHPVTQGMANFWTTDELWIDMENFKTTSVLASGFAPKSNKGNDEWEPVLMARQVEKGRALFLVLGHDAATMKNLGFKTLLRRGTEWAATAKVTQAVPVTLQSHQEDNSFKIKYLKSKNTLGCLTGDQLLWQYNFDKSEGKPYFHPLSTTKGTPLTWLRPKDHPWHRALWFSWKYINGVNYWEEDRKTGISEGKTNIVSCKSNTSKTKGATINLELEYSPFETQQSILNEERHIEVSLPKTDGSYTIDWTSTFTALADTVVFDRTPILGEKNGKKWGGYAGFSIRMNESLWDVLPLSPEKGNKELHGTKASYLSYQAKDIQGKEATLTIFDHPDNLRAKNSWYVENSLGNPFYYFSPASLFHSSYKIEKGESFTLRYRVLVEATNNNEQLTQSNWQQFKNL